MQHASFHPGLTDDQKMIVDTVSDFARGEVLTAATAIDEDASVPEGIDRQLVEMGLYGVGIAEEKGGSGFDVLSRALVIHELARSSAGVAALLAHQTAFAGGFLVRGGDRGQKSLRSLVGEGMKFAVVLDDARSGPTAAKRGPEITQDGGTFKLHGERASVAFAASAASFIVVAKGPTGTMVVLLDAKTNGIVRGAKRERLGCRGISAADCRFDGVDVPNDAVLASGAEADAMVAGALGDGRIAFAALGTGIMRAALDTALAYGVERRQFGVPIVSFEALREKLADGEVRYLASLNLVVAAARAADSGDDAAPLARAAWLETQAAAMAAADDALQIHGGYGYSQEYAAERHYRDARYVGVALGGVAVAKLEVSAALHPACRPASR